MKMLLMTSLLMWGNFAKAQLTSFQADYIVPDSFNNAQLSPVPEDARRFSVTYLVIKSEDGSESALFTLPRELTGRKVTTLMTVTKKEMVNNEVIKTLEGDLGTATCKGPWATTVCLYHFPKLKIDPTEVNQYLNMTYSSNSSRKLELESISKVFGCDPIGEIQTLKGPASVAPSASCEL